MSILLSACHAGGVWTERKHLKFDEPFFTGAYFICKGKLKA